MDENYATMQQPLVLDEIDARDAMPEDDPIGNVKPESVFKQHRGAHRTGAKKLASLYSRGEYFLSKTNKNKLK